MANHKETFDLFKGLTATGNGVSKLLTVAGKSASVLITMTGDVPNACSAAIVYSLDDVNFDTFDTIVLSSGELTAKKSDTVYLDFPPCNYLRGDLTLTMGVGDSASVNCRILVQE
jgi:hypothetical protein